MIKLMFGTFIGFIFALVIFLEIENRHPSAENLNFKLARQAKRMFTDKKKLWEIYQSQLKTLNDHEWKIWYIGIFNKKQKKINIQFSMYCWF